MSVFPAEEEPKTDEPTGRADAYEAVFSALAHPARRRVLLTVYFNGGSMTAGEIAAVFAHSWQTTTRHLQVLEAAGLLSSERQGRSRVYRLQRSRLDLVTQWLAHFSQQHGAPDHNQGEPLT
ncbi:ArsR/SmtB family transcription factor [Streptomyces acidicola]|uniref:ArsR/SmtB family transcription factor n=1 Tax=Streptomyces acidicola TaxID=2596892 RepID=UPI003439AEC4